MAFDPQEFDVKPIGDAGLTERTVLDGSERILVQSGPDENVDTTPMEFVKFQTIQAKIDALKGTGWAGQTIKGNADAISLKESIANVNTLKGSGWSGQTVKGNADAIAGNADAIAGKENLANKKSTLAENSEIYYPNQKAVNDGLDTKLDVDSSGNINPTGIYLGGTGSANYLDDYEEGTFTPTAYGNSTAGTCSYIVQYGRYTRIGNIVHIYMEIGWSGHTGTGDTRLGGLPFINSRNYQPLVIHPAGLQFSGMMTCLTYNNIIIARSMSTSGVEQPVAIPVATTPGSPIGISGTYYA